MANENAYPHQDDLVAGLSALKGAYGEDYKEEFEDLIFQLEEGDLGNGRNTLLNVEGIRLRVGKRTKVDDVSKAVATFILDLLKKKQDVEIADDIVARLETLSGKVHTEVQTLTEPLVPGQQKTYWRDVVAELNKAKRVFGDTDFSDDLHSLRLMIHKRELGKKDFSAECPDGTFLSIEEGDSDEDMLSKLSVFFKHLQEKHPERYAKVNVYRPHAEDRIDIRRYWAHLKAGLHQTQKAFEGETIGKELTKLQDLISNYELRDTGFSLDTPWAKLNIAPFETGRICADKIAEFLEAVQNGKGNAKKFPKGKRFSAGEAKQKEADPVFRWRDIVAQLDQLQQSDFPQEKFPALQKLKEMIENNELGVGSRLMMDIGPIHLEIEPEFSDSDILHRVAVFLGELKQIIQQTDDPEETPLVEGHSENFWRDILASLESMDDVYGDNLDFQQLKLNIEAGIVGAVDGSFRVAGKEVSLKSSDSDQKLRDKLVRFIRELSDGKENTLNERTLQRLKQAEDEHHELRKQYAKQQKELEHAMKKEAADADALAQMEQIVRRLKQEVKTLKDDLKAEQSRSSSYSTSRSSYG